MAGFLTVKKLVAEAKIPTRAFSNDAGLDLYVLEDVSIEPNSFKDIKTGLAVKISDGFWGMIRPRSSTFFKRNLVVHEGTIDPGYTGELNVGVYNPSEKAATLVAGDRIAQLVIIPLVLHEVIQVDHLPYTPRGTAGFGSTGH